LGVPIQFGHGTKDNNNNERARMRKLTQEEYETLQECLEVDAEIRRYSGQAMYGEECLAIVSEDEAKTFLLLGIMLSEHDSAEANTLAEMLIRAEFRGDSMGRDSAVVYFPSIQLPDGVLAEDDEDEE
jgi:hypothetical protein